MPIEAHPQRKLAAIMFTDMVGFSVLAQRDETLALELLESYRVVLRAELSRHGGQEIKTMGDGFLLKFESVLGGVRYAIAVQQQFRQRNQKEPPPRHIRARIGLHVGDIIQQEQDVLGDDVNIAARLEPLAPPEGICLSEAAARQVQNKLEYPLISRGFIPLKNIQQPLEVFQIDWDPAPSAAGTHFPWLFTLRSRLKANKTGILTSSLAAMVLGCLLHGTRLGEGMANLSYDLLTLNPRHEPRREVVVIEMDELSYRALHQDYDKLWDRDLHARLLNKIRGDGAKLVVMDIFLSDAGTNLMSGEALNNTLNKNRRLADAIRDNTNVVLAADLVASDRSDIVGDSVVLPLPEFADAASNRWGIARAEIDPDLTVRRHFNGTETDPSLPWRAAELAGAVITRIPGRRMEPRYLRYYGASPAFQRLSYHQALEQPPGYFRAKLVFVGGRPRILKVGQQSDVFRTPYMRWSADFTPGVEIVATSTLNLLRGDWYYRLPSMAEFALLLCCGALCGGGLALVAPLTGLILAATSAFAIAGLALGSAWTLGGWFNWAGLAFVQLPGTLIWIFLWKSRPSYQRPSRHHKSMDGLL